MVSPLTAPAAAKVWNPDTAAPSVIVPVPVVAVVILARLMSFVMGSPYAGSGKRTTVEVRVKLLPLVTACEALSDPAANRREFTVSVMA